MFTAGFQQLSSNFMTTYFSQVSQMATSPMMTQQGIGQLYSMANQFAQLAMRFQQPVSMQRVTGFAAMPDFTNAGQLEADPKTNTVTTPGGFKISVKDGQVKIQNPNGKWTTIKAEPPGRTITSVTKGKESRTSTRFERVIPHDPAVRESDGDVWRYQGLGTFKLPDGTKIRINEAGKGKTLHIDQIDIYNGNKHVAVRSQLTSAKYKTVKTDIKRKFGSWKNVSSRRFRRGWGIYRRTTQQREVTTTKTEHQVVDQKFKTTMSEVRNDGYAHDFMNFDGRTFTLAKDGAAWSQFGREVVSGAGKGKDNKALAYKLGGYAEASNVGARALQVPWKFAMFDAITQTQNLLSSFAGGFQNSAVSSNFYNMGQAQSHLGALTQLPNWGNATSVFGGAFGGGALYGNFYAQSFSPAQVVNNMFSAISNMNGFFSSQMSMGSSISASMFSQFKA